MILAIDVGNTRIKSAVFENNTIIEATVFSNKDLKISIENILNKFKEITVLVISSVGKQEKKAFESFNNRVKIHFITHENVFPFKNQYATPHTLGIDRMVLFFYQKLILFTDFV